MMHYAFDDGEESSSHDGEKAALGGSPIGARKADGKYVLCVYILSIKNSAWRGTSVTTTVPADEDSMTAPAASTALPSAPSSISTVYTSFPSPSSVTLPVMRQGQLLNGMRFPKRLAHESAAGAAPSAVAPTRPGS